MRVLLTGGSGFIGSALTAWFSAQGHEVIPLRRGPPSAGQPTWVPDRGEIVIPDNFHVDAVIHLAGESIAAHRWTHQVKRRILNSRVQGTTLLARALATLPRPPEVLVCASAVGFYGDRGNQVLDERSGPGTGFLCEVCRQWEAATEPAAGAGIRVVHARIGVVVDPRGGALQKMLPAFRLGAGGVIGSGRQYMSWVSLDDLVRMFGFVLENRVVRGAVNFTGPSPCTNRAFTRILARVLKRPALFRVPPQVLHLAVGEMAHALLLASTCVHPRVLETAGYAFLDTDLEKALRRMLQRNGRTAAS